MKKLTFLVLSIFFGGAVSFLEMILIYFLVLSFSPLFLILVFIFYLLWFGVSLIFLMGSYYYSYIVYLLFFSGLLIMFMYVCSIICNEKIYIEFSSFSFFVLLLIVFFLSGGSLFMSLGVRGGLMFYEFLGLLKFFFFSFSSFSVFFIFYLFFCLIVVYEVIKKNKGPLRMSPG